MHERSYVCLPELYADIRLQRDKTGFYIGHEAVNRIRHRNEILSGCGVGILRARLAEAVDKVKLEAVEIPLLHRVLISRNEIFAHIRITRVKYCGIAAVA